VEQQTDTAQIQKQNHGGTLEARGLRIKISPLRTALSLFIPVILNQPFAASRLSREK
jgi:hypothetical protein